MWCIHFSFFLISLSFLIILMEGGRNSQEPAIYGTTLSSWFRVPIHYKCTYRETVCALGINYNYTQTKLGMLQDKW